MFYPWYSTMMLATESCNVIALRVIKMSFGGQAALDEGHRMLKEKIAASWEAGTTLMGGGNVSAVIDRYREHVAANASRLVVKKDVRSDQFVTFSDEEVRIKAYDLWSSGGRRHGHDREDWLQAIDAANRSMAAAPAGHSRLQ